MTSQRSRSWARRPTCHRSRSPPAGSSWTTAPTSIRWVRALRDAGAAATVPRRQSRGGSQRHPDQGPAPAASLQPAGPARPGDDRAQGDGEGPRPALRDGRGVRAATCGSTCTHGLITARRAGVAQASVEVDSAASAGGDGGIGRRGRAGRPAGRFRHGKPRLRQAARSRDACGLRGTIIALEQRELPPRGSSAADRRAASWQPGLPEARIVRARHASSARAVRPGRVISTRRRPSSTENPDDWTAHFILAYVAALAGDRFWRTSPLDEHLARRRVDWRPRRADVHVPAIAPRWRSRTREAVEHHDACPRAQPGAHAGRSGSEPSTGLTGT